MRKVPTTAEDLAMPRDHQHNPDPNVNAARIVAEATGDEKSQLPASGLKVKVNHYPDVG